MIFLLTGYMRGVVLVLHDCSQLRQESAHAGPPDPEILWKLILEEQRNGYSLAH